MRIAVLTLAVVLPLAADNDPFAAYHQVIEQRLATLSERSRPEPAPDPPPVEPSDALPEFARRFWNRREPELRAALARLERYRPALEAILEQEGVPRSLIAVVLVESGAHPLALSPKQARGLWQFIPATARQYGLTVTAEKDERVHLEPATRAAARYLRDLHARFGNWEVALAAYNAGPEAVARALQRGGATTYALLLPEETRRYVPAVLSAMDLLTPAPRPASVVYAPAGVSN